MASRAALLFAVSVPLGALAWFGPFLLEEREVVESTPVSAKAGEPTVLELGGGRRACMSPVTIGPGSEVAQIGVDARRRPGPPLELTLERRGYRAASRIEGGYSGRVRLHAPIEPPERSLIGAFCVRNAGRRAVALQATADSRTTGRSSVRVDGVPVAPDLRLSFLRRERASLLARVPEILREATSFLPFGSWLVWIIAALALVGVPAGVGLALFSSLRSEDAGPAG